MKTFRHAAIAFIAILSAVACNKEINETKPSLCQGAEESGIIINAVAGSLGTPDTKAVGVYGYQVVWESNDRISVTDGETQATFNLVEGVGEILGKFAQEGTATLSGEVTGYYPASILNSDGTVLWPTAQKWSESLTGIPMTASATITGGSGTEFCFESLGGMLQLVLTTTEGSLPMKSITVSADNLATPIVLDCAGLTLSAAAKTAGLAIPAGKYTNVQLRFESSNGSVKTMTSTSLDIKKGVVSKITLALSGFVSMYPDYLSFTARGSSVPVGIKYDFGKPESFTFEYCLDLAADKWTSFTADPSKAGIQPIVTITDGQTVFLRGKNAKASINKENAQWIFDFGAASNRVSAAGNIMSLLDPEVKSSVVGDYAFKHLFRDAVQLVSAPKLPAMTLGKGCYSRMFSGCANLTEAPELPAAYLADICYEFMFRDTGLITTAPMYASTLAYECCQYMYESCSSLVSARALAATNLAASCYEFMFENCTSLIEAPMLPSRTLADNCYAGMFRKCSSLRIAPALPATEMADNCYMGMFEDCPSLVVAPELPAMTLAGSCYNFMFYGCTSLVNAPELPATKIESMCYYSMFKKCSSLVNAPHLPASTLADKCYMDMFSGCTSLRTVSVNFTKWDIDYKTTLNWLGKVSGSGTFYCPSGLSETFGSSYIPEGWTVVSDKIPSNKGDLYWSNGIEGMYVCDVTVNGSAKKLVIATCNLGANSMYDKGRSYSKAQLDALTMPEGWSIPTYADMTALAALNFYDDFNEGASCAVTSNRRYYIPYTHHVADNKNEARLWMKDDQPYDFYWFRSDNVHGRTDLDTSSNYIRLVKHL